MTRTKTAYDRLFSGLSLLGVIFLLVEITLQSMGRSVCVSEGCRIVSQHTRFGDISILLLGLLTFVSLAAFSILEVSRDNPAYGRMVDFILVVSLAGEGFLAGYQAFRIGQPCISCLAVLALFVVLGVVRGLGGRKEVAAGFASMVAVFGFFYLILPAGGGPPLPEGYRYVLFSRDGCPHCVTVAKALDDSRIPYVKVPVKEYTSLLRPIGVRHVPTLAVNDPYEKLFLTGERAIGKYIADRVREGSAAGADPGRSNAAAPKPRAATAVDRPPRTVKRAVRPATPRPGPEKKAAPGPADNSFLGPLISPPDEEGLCGKDENCD